MMASVEVGDKKFWIEYLIKVKRKRKVFNSDDVKVILEKEEVEDVEFWGIYEYGEVARAALRLIEELFHEGKSRDEVLEYIQKYYGMKEYDAKELLDFAEWYLFSG